MGFKNLAAVAQAYEDGRTYFSAYRKTFSGNALGGGWVDMMMASGFPPINYYATAPYEAAVIPSRFGIPHGDSVAPSKKYLAEWNACVTNLNAYTTRLLLCDYLLYYPFIDLNTSDVVDFVNDVTLPRYTDGNGVALMLIVSGALDAGTGVQIGYINSNGEERAYFVNSVGLYNSPAGVGNLATSDGNNGTTNYLFTTIRGDAGVRRLTQIRPISPRGGLLTAVLVKPLASLWLPETNTFAEKQFISMTPGLPEIKDGAVLGFMAGSTGSIISQIGGHLRFVWD